MYTRAAVLLTCSFILQVSFEMELSPTIEMELPPTIEKELPPTIEKELPPTIEKELRVSPTIEKELPPTIEIFTGDWKGSERAIACDVQSTADIILTQLPVLRSPGDKDPSHHYQLRCLAPYPILFFYEGQGIPKVRSVSYRRLHNGLEHFHNSSHYRFEARLLLSPIEGNTGKYICKPAVKSAAGQEKQIYLYIPGPQLFITDKPKNLSVFGLGGELGMGSQISLGDNTEGQILLRSNSRRSVLVIPCAISNPSGRIILRLFEKVHWVKDNQTVLQEITSSGKFYPKKGFLIKVGNSSLGTSREFTCEAYDPSDQKFIKANSTISYVLDPTSEKLTLGIKYISEESRATFTCSVFPKDAKVFFGRRDCHSPTDCKFLDIRLRKSYHPIIMSNPTGLFSLTYRTLYTQIPDWRDGISGQKTGSVLPVSGLFFCSAGRNSMTSLVYNSFEHTVLVPDVSEKPEAAELLQIVEFENTLEPSFLCIGRSFFYSRGFVWAVEMEDGRSELLNGEERESPSAFIKSKLTLPFYYYNDTSSGIVTGTIKTLTCYAPIWQSRTLWDNVSFTMSERDGHFFDYDETRLYNSGLSVATGLQRIQVYLILVWIHKFV